MAAVIPFLFRAGSFLRPLIPRALSFLGTRVPGILSRAAPVAGRFALGALSDTGIGRALGPIEPLIPGLSGAGGTAGNIAQVAGNIGSLIARGQREQAAQNIRQAVQTVADRQSQRTQANNQARRSGIDTRGVTNRRATQRGNVDLDDRTSRGLTIPPDRDTLKRTFLPENVNIEAAPDPLESRLAPLRVNRRLNTGTGLSLIDNSPFAFTNDELF